MVTSSEKRGAIIAGAILIGLGVAFLVGQFVQFSGGLVLIGLGVAFLAAWAYTKVYGFLVPGCILSGLGVGIMLTERGILTGSGVVLGLGLGFLAIYPLDLLWSHFIPANRGWWPLIPGGILTVVGLGTSFPLLLQSLQFVWPLALIAVGAWIIWRGMRSREEK